MTALVMSAGVRSWLHVLEEVSEIVQCDAQGAHGDAKGGLIRLMRQLRESPEHAIDAAGTLHAELADALACSDRRERTWMVCQIERVLWERVLGVRNPEWPARWPSQRLQVTSVTVTVRQGP